MSNIEIPGYKGYQANPDKYRKDTDADNEAKEKENQEKRAKQEHKIMLRNFKFKIAFYLLYITIFLFFIYIIKPITFAVELYFLVNADALTKGSHVLLAGWIVLFLIPLIHFWIDGVKIISIQETLFMKFYTTIIVLFELYVMIPIPFLHSKTIYSIYLFNERGYELIISPWLIFFPTQYVTSNTEIFRNLVASIFFIGYSIYLMQTQVLEINNKRTYTFLVAVEVINLLAYLIFMTKRITDHFSVKRSHQKGKRVKDSMKKLEVEGEKES